MKNPPEWAVAWADVFSKLLLPVALAVVGYIVTSGEKDKEVAASYVNTATGILMHKENDRELKEWAVNIINNYSRIPLPPEIGKSLVEGKVVIHAGGFSAESFSPESFDPESFEGLNE